MRERAGLGLVEEIQMQMDTVYGNGLDVRDVERETEEIQAQIDGTPLPEQQLEDGSFVKVNVDNPADSVNEGRFQGILYLVAEQDRLSGQTINSDNYVSSRTLSTGTGPACGGESFSFVASAACVIDTPSKCIFRKSRPFQTGTSPTERFADT